MKSLAIYAIVLFSTSAICAESELTVLMDSRQFGEHLSFLTGVRGCILPKDPDSPKDGECIIGYERYVRSGELLVRDKASGTCSLTTWSQVPGPLLEYQGKSLPAPPASYSEENFGFKCNTDGESII